MDVLQGSDVASGELRKLLQQSKGLIIPDEDTHGGVPTIRRGLSQLAAESRRLARARGSPLHGGLDAAAESAAQMFFANQGIDLTKSSRILRNIDMTKAYESLELISDLEVEKFLEHQHRMLVTTAIEESSALTAAAFRKHSIRSMDDDWSAAKRDILESMGYRSSGRASNSAFVSMWDHSQASLGDVSVTDANVEIKLGSAAGTRSVMGAKIAQYSTAVVALNQARVRREPFAFVSALLRTSTSISMSQERTGGTQSDVERSWALLKHMIGEPDAKPLKARCYESEYGVGYGATGYRRLCLDLIKGAKGYTEDLFRRYMDDTIQKNPHLRQHSRGGQMDLRSRVRQFLQVKFRRQERGKWPSELEDTDDGYPFWAEIYYCFRCGHVKEALEIARSKRQKHDVFFNCLDEFCRKDHTSRSLPEGEWKQLQSQYNKIRTDYYKKAMFNLVGMCGPLDDFSKVTDGIEDFMWYKLSMLWETGETFPHWNTAAKDGSGGNAPISLAALRDEIDEYGSAYWSSDGRYPLIYFNVLLMSQQFEKAVDYLVRETSLFIEGVHFAAALDYYGLLRTSPGSQPELLHRGRFDLPRIIDKYVEPFMISNPAEAFHYTFLLCRPQAPPPIAALSTLVLKTQAFDTLIGVLDPTSGVVRRSGCLYQYLPEHARRIILEAARQAETLESIKLKQLAGDNDAVADDLLRRLAQLANAPSSSKLRLRIKDLASQFVRFQSMSRPTRQDHNSKKLTSLTKLLRIVEFFELFHAGESFQLAIDTIEAMGFSDENPQRMQKEFQDLDSTLKRTFGHVIVAMMDMLNSQINAMASSRQGRELHAVRQMSEKLRRKKQAWVQFANSNTKYIPADIISQLVLKSN